MEVKSLAGTTLDGRYEIGRMIGGGGMGHVYEAQHAGTGRRVAIKVISTGDMAKDAHIVGRFQREAKAAGAVDTQHICQVLDTGTDPDSGAPFMVMEFMTGEDVQQLLTRTGPIAADLALRIVAQTCLGLAKAHGVDVIHRDIKPANLFLAHKDGDEVIVKVLDFGIAKVKMEQAQSAENAGLTRTGMMLGSPLYMSPEQARGSKHIDHRADIWSLGVVLYQTLAGRTPFQHVDALGELIMAICSEAPPPVQQFAPWVEPEIAALVHRALRVNPAERFQTATEMYEAIKAHLPGGTAIETSMLVSLSETMRQHVARQLSIPPPAPLQTNSMPPPGYSPSMAPPPPSSAVAASGAGTTGGVSGTRAADAPRRNSTVFALVGGAAGMALVGGLAFFTLRGDPVAPPVTPAAAEEPKEAPAPPPPETAAGTTVAPVPQERTVKLVVITPDDAATVEVDGEPVKRKDGVIEITGPLGSVHKVRIALGKDEVEEDVVVTQIGAQPPKVELERSVPGAPPRPRPAATAAANTPPKPTAPAPGIETKFE